MTDASMSLEILKIVFVKLRIFPGLANLRLKTESRHIQPILMEMS